MRQVLILVVALSCTLTCRAQEKVASTFEDFRAVIEDGEAKAAPRRKATLAMGALMTPRSTAYLVARLEREYDESVRGAIVHGLANDPGGAGVEELLLRLAGDTSDRTLCAAASTHVWRLSIDWKQWYFDFFSARGTSRYHAGVIRAVAHGKRDGSHEFLRAICLKKRGLLGSHAIRYAAEALGIDAAYDDFIRPYLQPVTDEVMRMAAIIALGRARDGRFLSMLRKYSEVEHRRKQAATWMPLLAGMDDGRALAMILEIVEEPSPTSMTQFFVAARTMKSPVVLKWFRTKGAKHAQPLVRHVAVVSMREHPDSANVPVLARIADRGEGELAAAAIAALSRHERDAVEKTFVKLRRHRDPRKAADAMDAWYGVCGGESRFIADLVFHAGESRVWQLRVTAMELLRRKHVSAARYVFKKNARHSRAEVRIAAYEALTWSRDHETVDFLIAALDREEGRPLTHLIAALTNLTGTQWGHRVERWKEWWPKVRGGFELPARRDALKLASDDSTRYGFYGIGTDSKAVVFVVDISGSMAGRASTGTATRIVRAKAELIAAVRRFDETHRFNVIVYNGRPRAYSRQLVSCTEEERAKFEKWVNALRAGGATNLHDSLLAALRIEDVDTVFLLADGGANAGRVTELDLILDVIRRRNRFLRVTINAIGIGVAARMQSFIRDLAEQNRGSAVLL